MKVGFDFQIVHSEENGKHYITFVPSKKVEGYPEKRIEVTSDQWDELRYHFMSGSKGIDLSLNLCYC